MALLRVADFGQRLQGAKGWTAWPPLAACAFGLAEMRGTEMAIGSLAGKVMASATSSRLSKSFMIALLACPHIVIRVIPNRVGPLRRERGRNTWALLDSGGRCDQREGPLHHNCVSAGETLEGDAAIRTPDQDRNFRDCARHLCGPQSRRLCRVGDYRRKSGPCHLDARKGRIAPSGCKLTWHRSPAKPYRGQARLRAWPG